MWHAKHPIGAKRDDSGPSVGNISLHGFCFAAINSRSGTPNIPLGLTAMILGPVLATWVLMGSDLLQSIPDLGKPSQALTRFGLVMMTAQMNEQMPFHNFKMVSIGSDCRIWVSE